MATQPAPELEVTPVTTPETTPETTPKPPARSRPHTKKALNLPIPEELLMLMIDDEGGISGPMKTILPYGLAGAFLAELVLANKIHLEEDRITVSGTAPSGDTLIDDILAMITAEKKPRKLSHWVQVIGSKLSIKQVALRLVERKVIGIEKKVYSWVIPFPAFPLVQASAKYLVKLHLRGIVLAGEPANSADIILLGLLEACRLQRLVFTRDERKSADKKGDAMVQGEVFGEAVAKVLAEK